MSSLVSYIPSSCIAFNGGKDSTVVLYMIIDVCRQHSIAIPPCIFYDHPDEFPEVKAFVAEIVCEFSLTLYTYSCSYKESMQDISSKGIQYIFMGQRRGDPYCESLSLLQPISYAGFEHICRINPIFDWSYHQVWKYLTNKLVCRLYNEGYTSLGRKSKTQKHPSLQNPDGTYQHARNLLDEHTERDCRV